MLTKEEHKQVEHVRKRVEEDADVISYWQTETVKNHRRFLLKLVDKLLKENKTWEEKDEEAKSAALEVYLGE